MDTKIINSLRSLAIDMINDRMMGDAGLVLSLSPSIYTIFSNHLNFNPGDGTWINRDRFVLGEGLASSLLYSTLFYSGYDISLDSLKKYGRLNSKLPLYPERNLKIGVEASIGDLPVSLGLAVGEAYAEKYLEKLLGKELIDYKVYVLVTDNDLMDGSSYEVLSFASRNNLNNLIIIYNSFETTKCGKKKEFLNNDILSMVNELGFFTEVVNSSEDYISIDKAIAKAKLSNKPSFIEIKSLIAIGTSNQGSYNGHENVLSVNDLELVKEKMNITQVPYHISNSAINEFQSKIDSRISPIYNRWVSTYNDIISRDDIKKNLISLLEEDNHKMNLKNIKISFEEFMKEDLRETNNNLMNAIAKEFPLLIGGSLFNNDSKISLEDDNKNIYFSLSPKGTSLITNGLALGGLKPFVCANLGDSLDMLSTIKLSSTLKENITYIFINDTIYTNKYSKISSPTFELGILRSIPNITLFRPADVNELVGSWDYIMNKKGTNILVLTSDFKGILNNTSKELTTKGAYIVKKEMGRLSGVLVSSGAELETTLRLSEELEGLGIFTRVVSMPSFNLYTFLTKETKEELFPVGAKVIVIEPSIDANYNKLVYSEKYLINLKDYMESATKKELIDITHFNLEDLIENIQKLLK
mgnify:CR=1 FL=1